MFEMFSKINYEILKSDKIPDISSKCEGNPQNMSETVAKDMVRRQLNNTGNEKLNKKRY